MLENEKFELLRAIIQDNGIPVKVRIRKPKKNQKRKPIDGWTVLETQTITMTLPKPVRDMSPWTISEATAVLSHEYGHAVAYERSEKRAWNNAIRFFKKFAILKPVRFDEIMQTDLAEYTKLDKLGLLDDDSKFSYSR